MDAYFVRLAANREVVGLFVASSVASLAADLVDQVVDPGACEYTLCPPGGLYVPHRVNTSWPLRHGCEDTGLGDASFDEGWAEALIWADSGLLSWQPLVAQACLYSVGAAARQVGCSSKMIQNWIARGVLPSGVGHRTGGGHWRFNAADLDVLRSLAAPTAMRRSGAAGPMAAADAAAAIGVSADLLRCWRRRGFIEGIGIPTGGGHWRYTAEDVALLRQIADRRSAALRDLAADRA